MTENEFQNAGEKGGRGERRGEGGREGEKKCVWGGRGGRCVCVRKRAHVCWMCATSRVAMGQREKAKKKKLIDSQVAPLKSVERKASYSRRLRPHTAVD